MSHINTHKVAKNSILLYIRMLVSMLITLWTTRIVLQALGVDDYGIYNVVAGFVVMFGIVSNSLSAAISRYITYELGHGDEEKLKQIFRTSVFILFIIALIALILSESIGLWFLNYKLNIKPDQLAAANWVYQFSILAFLVDVISVPYNAAIIAHERMKIFAYIGIGTAFAKFGVAYAILAFPQNNRLITYSALLLFISVSIRIFYNIYCKRNFAETNHTGKVSFNLIKDIFGFAGWNFIGSSAGILREQGVNVILNVFFGSVVNASRGIAVQVSTAATTFANNFMIALNPQITKSYAAGDRSESINLGFMGSRMGFYLMFIIALPVILEAPSILKLWLIETPQYSIIFVRLILINALIDVLSSTLMTLMLANGNIRNYQIVVGSCNIMVLPLAYIFFKFGFPPQTAMYVGIIMSIVALICRLLLLHKMIGLSITQFFYKVILKIVVVAIISIALIFIPINIISLGSDFIDLIIISLICFAITVFTIYIFGLYPNERIQLNKYIRKILKR